MDEHKRMEFMNSRGVSFLFELNEKTDVIDKKLLFHQKGDDKFKYIGVIDFLDFV